MQHLQKTRGLHPSSQESLSLCAAPNVRTFRRANASTRFPSIFHLPYTLPSSVSRNPFVCHSYENTRGVGVFFPFWNVPFVTSQPWLFRETTAAQFPARRRLCRHRPCR